MKYILKLYVTGKGSLSVQALVTVRRICEDELRGHYQLEVIDVLKQPWRAEDAGVDATPTLCREQPEPARRIVGNFCEPQRLREELIVPGHEVAS